MSETYPPKGPLTPTVSPEELQRRELKKDVTKERADVDITLDRLVKESVQILKLQEQVNVELNKKKRSSYKRQLKNHKRNFKELKRSLKNEVQQYLTVAVKYEIEYKK